MTETKSSQVGAPKADTRETTLALIQQGIDEVKALNPDHQNKSLSIDTYMPGVDLLVQCEQYLGPTGSANMDASLRKLNKPNLTEEEITAVREECLELLNGAGDLQAQWGAMFSNETLVRMKAYFPKEANENSAAAN